MLARYQPRFDALSPDQISLLATALDFISEGDSSPLTGADLFAMCEAASLDQAAVVMSLARSSTVLAVRTVEALVGAPVTHLRQGQVSIDPITNRPILTPDAPSGASARRPVQRQASARRSDPRTITHVASNPKKPGSASHARFALYQVGVSVDAALALGLTAADIRYDEAHGYIQLQVTK